MDQLSHFRRRGARFLEIGPCVSRMSASSSSASRILTQSCLASAFSMLVAFGRGSVGLVISAIERQKSK
jgi:hypothetical protein